MKTKKNCFDEPYDYWMKFFSSYLHGDVKLQCINMNFNLYTLLSLNRYCIQLFCHLSTSYFIFV